MDSAVLASKWELGPNASRAAVRHRPRRFAPLPTMCGPLGLGAGFRALSPPVAHVVLSLRAAAAQQVVAARRPTAAASIEVAYQIAWVIGAVPAAALYFWVMDYINKG